MKQNNGTRIVRISQELDDYLIRDLEMLRQDLERLGIKKRISKTVASKLLAEKCKQNGINIQL